MYIYFIYFRLSSKIAKSLKSLFPLFIGIFIENAAEMLKLNNFAKVDSPYFDDQYGMKKSILLVDSIIETFLTAFTYDASQKFLSRDYFNLIMEPLVDQVCFYHFRSPLTFMFHTCIRHMSVSPL